MTTALEKQAKDSRDVLSDMGKKTGVTLSNEILTFTDSKS